MCGSSVVELMHACEKKERKKLSAFNWWQGAQSLRLTRSSAHARFAHKFTLDRPAKINPTNGGSHPHLHQQQEEEAHRESVLFGT